MVTERRGIFLGSKEFGLSILRILVGSSPAVRWQIVCPDDRNDPRCALQKFQEFARDNDLPLSVVRTSSEARKLLSGSSPDVVFACGWYWILPAELIATVPLGCFGIHNSLLPKYRGWSPLVWSIINGDAKVGSSLFQFASGVDDGDLLAQFEIDLAMHENVVDALQGIEAEIQKNLPDIWSGYLRGEIKLTSQKHENATYCGRRIEADGKIDWKKTALEVHNFIRAQAPPYPGAFAFDAGQRKVVFIETDPDPRTYYGTPGQILEVQRECIVVCCGGSTALVVRQVAVDGVVAKPGTFFKSQADRLV